MREKKKDRTKKRGGIKREETKKREIHMNNRGISKKFFKIKEGS
jgi:hypothetical protein